MSTKACVIIEVQGGKVEGVICDRDIGTVIIVDHDTQGADKETLRRYPMTAKSTTEVAAEIADVHVSEDLVLAARKTLGL